MGYQRLRLHQSCPQIVADFIRGVVEDHFFADVRAMLRLPLPDLGITAGCNFAALEVLMAVVGGVSVTLFDAQGGKETGNRGELFRTLLTEAYPWTREPTPLTGRALVGVDASKVIYSTFRNPLTHSLGKREHRAVVKVNRVRPETSGLSEQTLETLESRADFPTMAKEPLPTVWERSDATVIFVERFYWGVRMMIETLSGNEARMSIAASLLQRDSTA
jgi:hypothetical protein